jgi:hypothetical protein
MILKRVLTGVAAMVLGLSLSQAQANILVVDDFINLGPIPTTSDNTWSYAGATDAIGGVRDFSKNNGGQAVFGGGGSKATLTTTASGSAFHVMYDGAAGTGTSYLNPRVDITDYAGGYLSVLTPDVALNGSTTATATLMWSATPTGSVQTSTLVLTGGPTLGGYHFKISDFSSPIPTNGLQNIACIQVRLAGLGGSVATPGLTSFSRIFFSDTLVPEPSSFVLAALGVMGVVVARRRKSA